VCVGSPVGTLLLVTITGFLAAVSEVLLYNRKAKWPGGANLEMVRQVETGSFRYSRNL